jgi:hypothetical protein
MRIGPLLILSRSIFLREGGIGLGDGELESDRQLDRDAGGGATGPARPDPAGHGEPRTVRKQPKLTASTISRASQGIAMTTRPGRIGHGAPRPA